MVSGFFWLYVFGDSEPLSQADTMLIVLFFTVLIVTWAVFIVTGFSMGKSLEDDPKQNSKHVVISIIATLVPLLLILLHQFSVGNIGPETDSVICSEFCRANGYAVSSMSPKLSAEDTCSCLDAQGKEVVSMPVALIRAGNSQ
jgi:hypothetical protein